MTTKNKPSGSVQQVLNGTLKKSLVNSGINPGVSDAVAEEVSSELGQEFASQVRINLNEEIRENEDFDPAHFPHTNNFIKRN